MRMDARSTGDCREYTLGLQDVKPVRRTIGLVCPSNRLVSTNSSLDGADGVVRFGSVPKDADYAPRADATVAVRELWRVSTASDTNAADAVAHLT